ncbi:hypothetical protein QN277_029337 [Acacia crassicarpa]|uniref:Pectinesterase inhibitor domain-containing protein n=1 Tax=Acacia crassicarpa TaxID=499986 RepID=A0AAE1MG38_9FABA|nr:hypothetical protein QN277_029337 [Acacia crassicarpa]
MKAQSSQLLSLLLLIAATFHLLPPSSAARASASNHGNTDFIRSVCNNTVYPDVCNSHISRYAHAIKQNPAALSRVGVALSHSVVRGAATSLSGLSGQAKGRAAHAISDCISTLGEASDQISESLGQLRQITAGKGGDFKFAMDTVLTRMSAALTNEDTCIDGFEEEPKDLVKKVVDIVTEAEKFTSIALAFVNYYAKKGSP